MAAKSICIHVNVCTKVFFGILKRLTIAEMEITLCNSLRVFIQYIHVLGEASTLGSFRRATQRAVRRRKQPTLTVLVSSGRCALQALSRMSDAAQPCIDCV